MKTRATAFGLLVVAAVLLSGVACGGGGMPPATAMPTPPATPTPPAMPAPYVNTFVELVSAVTRDENGVTIYGVTNLPDGAILRAELLLFDDFGGSPEAIGGGDLEPQQAVLIRKLTVSGGNYSAHFDLSYYAGGKCVALLEFLPYVGQPAFISNAFGDKGQKMTGGHVGGEPPSDWGVMRTLDDFVYYRCPVLEFSWYPGETPVPTSTP